MMAATGVHATVAVHAATVPREGGAGPHSLGLSVATDTLPGTAATRYAVPAAAPVVVRYTLVNDSEAGILNLHITDPDVPDAAISCAGGTALLPPLASRTCTATVPAADGSRVRTVHASGTLAWFGTETTASAATGYVGYQASLNVQELVAGSSTDPGKPDSLTVGAPVPISYQITNTGDVPLNALTLHSTLNGTGGCPTSARQLAPGAHVVCTLAPHAATGLHVDTVVASATPQLTVLNRNGGLAAAPPVQASDQGAYIGVAPASAVPVTGADHGNRPAGVSHGGSASAAAGGSGHGSGGAGGSSGGGGGIGAGGGSSSAPQQTGPGLALKGGVPQARAGAGFPLLLRHARHSLPWLMLVFLVVLVPVIVRLARGNSSAGR